MKKAILGILICFLAAGCSSQGANGVPVSKSAATEEQQNEMIQTAVKIEPGDKYAKFTVALKNNGSEKAEFTFMTGQKFEIEVKDLTGRNVYVYSRDRMFTQAIETIILEPGEEKVWEAEWDYTDNGKRVPSGDYMAKVTVKAKQTGQEEGSAGLETSQTFQVPKR